MIKYLSDLNKWDNKNIYNPLKVKKLVKFN